MQLYFNYLMRSIKHGPNVIAKAVPRRVSGRWIGTLTSVYEYSAAFPIGSCPIEGGLIARFMVWHTVLDNSKSH